MALESNPNQAFLGNTDEDDFAALDSMSFTGTQSQFGMNTETHSGRFGGGSSDNNGRVGDGREGGFTGVSESLFDRIRARTAEQQKQSLSSQSSQMSQPSSTQEAAQSSSQHSAFMSQQPSSEPTMEHKKNFVGGYGNVSSNNNAFDTAVADVSTSAPADNQNNNANINETTYSFSASAGEDFSPHVPQYGPSRDDPYYAAPSNQQQYPTSIQDKATMALVQTGETVKSLFGAGLSGAQAIGAKAQEKMGGGGGGGRGQRSYNNNFLLREDSLEYGNTMNTATMSQPPPAAVASGSEAGAAASDQAYSMFSYGKTFCQDLFGFVMELPPWGKGLVAVILLWALYVFFDFL